MNGVHDMGGSHGFGPIVREQNEPVFHQAWEKTVHGMMMSMMRARILHVDEMRREIERIEPARYLEASYYERWLCSLEENLIQKGVISNPEVETRSRELAGGGDQLTPATQLVEPPKTHPRIDIQVGPPRFAAGDRVAVRNVHPRGHTRLARYVRGKHGSVDRILHPALLPDLNAHGLGQKPENVYAVVFDAAELWGESAEPHERISIDVWESFLDPA